MVSGLLGTGVTEFPNSCSSQGPAIIIPPSPMCLGAEFKCPTLPSAPLPDTNSPR